MTQSTAVPDVVLQVTPNFSAQVPNLPVLKQVDALTPLAATADTRSQLSCQALLEGDTLLRARKQAADDLPRLLKSTVDFASYAVDALDPVNRLNDQMLNGRPPVDVPELREAMKMLNRNMRGIGKKYDPNDPKVLKKYEKAKEGFFSKIHLVKSFLDEFLDDVRSLNGQCDRVIKTLEGKQYQLLKNVAYYDEFYKLNGEEIDKLIYRIAVMEMIRDLAAQQANSIQVGDANLGDQRGEEQAQILQFVTLMDNKIIAFKSRLWVAWAMAPQIRTMRTISVGLSARIDQTIDITIPTMKSTIAIWLTLSEAQQAEQFNHAVEDTYNQVLTMFANAAKATVPALASALATPALDPRTILAWNESITAQADGIIAAIELGAQKRAELENAIVQSKQVTDAATQRVNEAQLEHVLAIANSNTAPLEIKKSVPAETQH